MRNTPRNRLYAPYTNTHTSHTGTHKHSQLYRFPPRKMICLCATIIHITLSQTYTHCAHKHNNTSAAVFSTFLPNCTKALHEHKAANPDHTTLLLSCYTKLKDLNQIDLFISVIVCALMCVRACVLCMSLFSFFFSL